MSISFSNHCAALLKLLLMLGLLSSCRSERVAFDFGAGNAQGGRNEDAVNPIPPATPAAQMSSTIHSAPCEPNRRSRQGAVARHTANSTLAKNPGREAASQIGFRKQLLTKWLLRKKVPGTPRAAYKPADSDYGITPVSVAIAALLLLSIFFIGIPLLIGAGFSLSYWTALVYWLLVVASVTFWFLLPMIIDSISYLFMSDEKVRERYENRR